MKSKQPVETFRDVLQKRRSFSIIFLIASLVVFLSVAAALLVRFALPQEDWVNAGPVASFPARNAPFLLEELRVFVVHLDADWIVLSRRSTHPNFSHCNINWQPFENKFIDPCSGASFLLDGSYRNGPSPGDMNRYAHEIREDTLWIQTTYLIAGNPLNQSSGSTPKPVRP